MGLHNQSMNLALSSDSKPRLKWTSDLHLCFLQAISQLGGPQKATPKRLMRSMGVPGLTLYHLKSHLQKHRLGKTLIMGSHNDNNQEDDIAITSQDINLINESNNVNHNDLHITQAWKMQIEVQRKLREQIEVQKHLQLRIEAQGKYLQSVLKKAQDTLVGYDSSMGIECAKTEGSSSSALSELTSCGSYGGKEERCDTHSSNGASFGMVDLNVEYENDSD